VREVATINAIVDQHVGDAAFLWLRRRREIDGPILGETDIGRMDQRLDANIEGVLASGKAGWKAAKGLFADYPEPGELFLLGVLALRWGDADALSETVAASAAAGTAGLSALSGAIARVPRESLRPFVANWLGARDARLRCLGLCALWHHRVDPGVRLSELLAASDLEVRLRALKLAGALKRRDLLGPVLQCLDSETAKERIAAALAACLLGEVRHAHPVLDKIVVGEPDLRAAAIELRLLTTPTKAGKSWLQSLLEQPAIKATATAAVGLSGDRGVVPWLIAKMRDPATAKSAGLALRDLFEVDFGDLALFTGDPSTLGADFAEADGPLPKADEVAKWWDEGHGAPHAGTFRSMRHLRLHALRSALGDADALLADWRRTRRFPAWL
jgi:uncharacterized protein (TIGR02270 family)